MDMEIKNSTYYKSSTTNTLKTSVKNNNITTEERVNKYFKDLQKEYPKINLKKNVINISSKNQVTVTLSPDLIKKALKDSDVDKNIRKSLDDFVKNKNLFKSYSCSKEGREVSSVSFFIDRRQRISCNIKFKDSISSAADTKENKKTISVMIKNKAEVCSKKSNADISLFYKYIKLLDDNNFTTLDVTV